MIALLSMLCVMGVFLAGAGYGAHSLMALTMLGLFVIALGMLIAAAETHGFEGYPSMSSAIGFTWADCMKALFRINETKGRLFVHDRVYVQTPQGPRAITSVFQARIGHELSIVFDTVEGDPQHTFNSLKQGVM